MGLYSFAGTRSGPKRTEFPSLVTYPSSLVFPDTVGIQLMDMSGNRMVETCPIAECHSVSSLDCNVWSSFCSFSYSRLCYAAVAFFYKREGDKWAGKVKLKRRSTENYDVGESPWNYLV